MPVTQGLANVGNLIKAIAGLLALFPGVAVLLGLVDIPPTLVQLVQVIAFSVGLIVVLAVLLLREQIYRLSNERAALFAIMAVALGGIAAAAYMQFATTHVVQIQAGETMERHIVPLSPSPSIQQIVAPHYGDYVDALHMSGHAERLKQLMRDERGSSVAWMIFLLILAQSLLMAPVIAAAWKLTHSERSSADENRRGPVPEATPTD